MSIRFKTQLLVATAAFAASATGAQAQVAFPEAELHGMGASSIAVILPLELNCVGGNNKVGKSDGTESTVTEGAYTGAVGAFDCATAQIQPNITGKYISSGSGTGRTEWATIANAFTTSSIVFPTASSWGTAWTNAHFVLSDAPLAESELNTFNSESGGSDANAAAVNKKKAGAAIQFPLYVLPVAVAYNPVYGHKVTENVDLKFNVKSPVSVDGTEVGGLRLTKAAYCGIFNGYITNWNDPKIMAANTTTVAGKIVANSLMDAADTTARWNQDGVPIRLAGRLDKSGTTDIFSRHLSVVCSSGVSMSGTNKYKNAAETLPYAASSAIDMTTVKSDSNYKPSVASTSLAGTADMISGAYYASGLIVTTKGAEASGKFILANGSSDLAALINLAPDKASANNSNVLLNGKIGYIAADYVKPTAGKTLFSAALEEGKTSATPKKASYLLPTAVNATTAFGTKILPPQSKKDGTYDPKGAFDRAQPLGWYDALYFTGSTLANPPTGYPMTGTSNMLTGTCFASSAVRNGLVTFLNATLGNLVLDSTNATISPDIFVGSTVAKPGLKAKIGIAPMPAAWTKAITETFLKYSKDKDGKKFLGDRLLYIQNGLPTKAGLGKDKTALTADDLNGAPTTTTVVKGKNVVTYNEATRNPNCVSGSGL